MEINTKNINPILGIIPQLFYDLIARIVPGLFVVLSSVLLLTGTNVGITSLNNCIDWYAKLEGVKLEIFLFGLLFSYIVSIFLDGLFRCARVIVKRFNKDNKFFPKHIEKAKISAINSFNKINNTEMNNIILPDVSIMYDDIRLCNPIAGSRLVKIRAEYHMARVISSGILVIYIVYLIKFGRPHNLESSVTLLMLSIAFIVFLLTSMQRRKRYYWGLCNHWVLLKQNEILEKYG